MSAVYYIYIHLCAYKCVRDFGASFGEAKVTARMRACYIDRPSLSRIYIHASYIVRQIIGVRGCLFDIVWLRKMMLLQCWDTYMHTYAEPDDDTKLALSARCHAPAAVYIYELSYNIIRYARHRHASLACAQQVLKCALPRAAGECEKRASKCQCTLVYIYPLDSLFLSLLLLGYMLHMQLYMYIVYVYTETHPQTEGWDGGRKNIRREGCVPRSSICLSGKLWKRESI